MQPRFVSNSVAPLCSCSVHAGFSIRHLQSLSFGRAALRPMALDPPGSSDGRRVPFTHEFLAEMLGTMRSTVSEAVANREQEKLIESSRGKTRIINRKGLQSVACECYWAVREAFESLLSSPASRPPFPLGTDRIHRISSSRIRLVEAYRRQVMQVWSKACPPRELNGT